MIECQNVKGSIGWNPRTFYSDLFLMAGSISSLKKLMVGAAEGWAVMVCGLRSLLDAI